MEFDNTKPIYVQIADSFCDSVLSGTMNPGDRVPSVREWGAEIGVNPNTVARSYELLTDRGVIFNKRGIGYFVTGSARDAIREVEKNRFLSEEWPAIRRKAELLGIDLTELINKR